MSSDSQQLPNSEEKVLSFKQKKAALWLAQGATIQKAADAAGVSEKSVDNWKKLPAFQQAVLTAEDELYRDALRLLKRTLKPAILAQIALLDAKSTAYVRQQAAAWLGDKALEIGINQDVEARLAELEALLSNSDVSPRG